MSAPIPDQGAGTVCVVVPLYQGAALARAALRSIARQTYVPESVVLVDDCGGDAEMVPVIASASEELERRGIRVSTQRHPSNRGVGAARNTGLRHADAQFVWFCDSDDEAEPDFLAMHMAALAHTGADFSTCRTQLVDQFGREQRIDERPFLRHVVTGEEHAQLILASAVRSYAPTKVFRREGLPEMFWDEGQLYEDVLPVLRLSLGARQVAMIDRPLYRYRTNPGSLSRALTPSSFDLLRLGSEIARIVGQLPPDPAWERLLRQYRYREVLIPLAHLAMRARHAGAGDPAVAAEALSKVRELALVADIPGLLAARQMRSAAFAGLIRVNPAAYSMILRHR